MTDAPKATFDAATLALLCEIIWSDSPDGFQLFYKFITDNACPKHVEHWSLKVYEAWGQDLGCLIYGFRGSTKTTFANVMHAYQIGLYPERSNTKIQASDPKAKDNAQAIMDIIANNPFWKLFFPHVVPDKDVAWGEDGYAVKRTDMDYGAWRRMCGPNPTEVGYGITSSTLIGGHPDGILDTDDIHDEENTRSIRERDHVKKKLTGTVLPMSIPRKTKRLAIGTPWVADDALAYLESTGAYLTVRTPLYRVVDEGTPGAVFLDRLGPEVVNQWIIPTWPEERPVAVIQQLRREWGPVDFPRMAQLDLTKVKAGILTFQPFPEERVDLNWPLVGGCDPAGTINPESGRDLDYFAHCYGAKPAAGGLIIVGGEYGRFTQAQAETMLKKPQSVFPSWSHTLMEGDGLGEMFFQTVIRNPGLRVVMQKTGGKSFSERILKQLAPHLELGTIRISTAHTPFLDRLRYEIENYGAGLDHDDCLSSLYWCARAAPDALTLVEHADLPLMRHPARLPNPFNSLAGSHV